MNRKQVFKCKSTPFCILAIVGGLLGQTSAFGEGVVNINQHRVDPPQCSTLPYDLFNAGNVNAFHVNADSSRFNCARTFPTRSRPRILSDDWKFTLAQEPTWFTYISSICTRANTNGGVNRGDEHYEHYQPDLEVELNKATPISRFSQFPDDGTQTSAKGVLNWMRSNLQTCAGMDTTGSGSVVPLSQNGALSVEQLGPGTQKVTWNGHPATLIGYGGMGAAAAAAAGSQRLSPDGYFRILRYHRSNLTRVWLMEQWTSLAVCQSNPTADPPIAFSGSRYNLNYDLEEVNPTFLSRLRGFVQAAADRGVVVQLSLFDKWGLVGHHSSCRGLIFDSPYRDANNYQEYLVDDSCSATCTSDCVDTAATMNEGLLEPSACEIAHPEFLDRTAPNSNPDSVNLNLVQRVAEEVGGIGNVIFEIINEARKGDDWPSDEDGDGIGDQNEKWQDQTARYLRAHLPVWVGRDAFNEVSRILEGKPTDAGGQSWLASPLTHNAYVYGKPDCQCVNCSSAECDQCQASPPSNCAVTMQTGLQMGMVAARDPATHTDFRGTTVVPAQPSTTGFTARANITRNQGTFALGFEEAGGDRVYVELRPPAASGQHRVALLEETDGGGPVEILALDWPDSDGSPVAGMRLSLVDRSLQWGWGRAAVYFDNVFVAEAVVHFSSDPNRAFFLGTKDSGPYLRTYGAIDNFEVTAHCVTCDVPTIEDGFESGNLDSWTSKDLTGSGNVLTVDPSSRILGTYSMKIQVSPNSQDPVFVEHLSLARYGYRGTWKWKMDLRDLVAPATGSGRTLRFLTVHDASGPHKIFYATRQTDGNWRLVAWSFDDGLGWVFAGGLFLSAYGPAGGVPEIECSWSADHEFVPSSAHGVLACQKVGTAESFYAQLNDYARQADRFRFGFLDVDGFGTNGGGGSVYFDDFSAAPGDF